MTENKRFAYKVIDGIYKIADNGKVLTHDEILNILNIQNELIIWLKRMGDVEGGEITPYTMIEHMTDEKIDELKEMIHKYYGDVE